MRSLPGLVALLLLALGPVAWGHGSSWSPPDAPPPRRDPPGPPPPPPPTPIDPLEPRNRPATPTPAPTPIDPPAATPGTGRPVVRTPGRRTDRRSAPASNDWRLWWEYNREYLLGLRRILRDVGPVSGTHGAAVRDPLGERREEVLETLRAVADRCDDRTLRAAALIALGRMGTERDAYRFARLMHDGRQPDDVREAAAVALGLLPEFAETAARDMARESLLYVLRNRRSLPSRARGLGVFSAGLRGRHDALLRMELIGRTAGRPGNGEEAADLALACGLACDPMAVPELSRAARTGRLGGERLTDLERAQVVQALGLCGDPNATGTLATVLRSRKAGLETQRAAALALGRLMREAAVPATAFDRAAGVLESVFSKSNDATLRGFAAIALGGARKPLATGVLENSIDHGGNAASKTYTALALGLAARTAGGGTARRIGSFLLSELDKTNEVELASALSLALGLAGEQRAANSLLERVESKGLPAPARGAAAQGLGLLRTPAPAAIEALTRLAHREASGVLLEDAVLALGLLGRRSVARELVDMLDRTSSSQVQGRLMLALSYLDHGAAVEPLLKTLGNRRKKSIVREFAAVALGLMGDRRESDILFALDAYYNLRATTRAAHELLRLY